MANPASKPRSRPWRPDPFADNRRTLDRLKELGAVQCTTAEAARSMGRPEQELTDFFERVPRMRAAFEQSQADALNQLRAAQFKLAQTSTTMAIFLGKQHLGQADRRELGVSDQASEIAGAAQRVRDALAAIAADRDDQGDH